MKLMANGVSVRGREFLQYKAFDATLMNAENNILMSFVGEKLYVVLSCTFFVHEYNHDNQMPLQKLLLSLRDDSVFLWR